MNRSPELEALLQGCLDGTLDESQEQELARLLQTSADARRLLRSHLRVEGGLLTLAQAGTLGCDDAAPTVPLPQPAPRRRLPLRPLAFGLAGVAAAALLLVALAPWTAPPPAGPPGAAVLAQVVELEGNVDVVSPSGEVRAAALRQPLQPGEWLRTGDGSSAAVIEFADLARLELAPETVVRLPQDGAHTVELSQGVLRGDAAARRNRQALVVAAGGVHVQGDRFVLSSTSPQSLRVDVQEGKAEVVRQRDRKRLAVASGKAVVVHAEADDMILCATQRLVTEPKRVLGFPGAAAVFFEPDGRHLLAASCHELQRFGPGPEAEKTPLSTDKNHGRLAAFSGDGATLAVYRGQRKEDPVILWDLRTKEQLVRIDARISDRRFALAPDASWLATADRDVSPPVCQLWDGKTGARRHAVAVEGKIDCLAAAPGGRRLALGLADAGKRGRNKVCLLDPRTGKQVAALPTRSSPPTALAFSPDGRYLAAGSTGAVQIWDVDKSELVRTIRGFERVLLTLAFSPDGNLLAGGTQDGQVWVWDAGRGAEVQVIQAGTKGVRLLAFAPDGRSLVTGGIKHQPLLLWEVPG
jgi:WD40 repeat protein